MPTDRLKILIAPDSFKGSLSALAAARAMETGLRQVFPGADFRLRPIADGGEGTVEALTAAGGEIMTATVHDPLGRPIEARWGLLKGGREAVVETAAASGLTLLHKNELNPLAACSFGTGELIRAALRKLHSGDPAVSEPQAQCAAAVIGQESQPDCGPDSRPGAKQRPRLIIGLGGSATNDGGVGCLRALGAGFLDSRGRALPPGGAALARLARIDVSGLDPLLKETEIYLASDVNNPLCGPQGASAVFGPQKGASPEMVEELDLALRRFARLAGRLTGRRADEMPGAGAAGGFGAGLMFFTGARIRPGIDIVLENLDLEEQCLWADLVFTGEGLSDYQTAFGKAPAGVAAAAKKSGKAVVCLSGALGTGANDLLALGFDALSGAVASIMSLEDCLRQAEDLLTEAAARCGRLIRLGRNLP